MGRNNSDFEGQALFHGTVHPFSVGDVVTPQGHEDFAYATPTREYAETRAKDWVGYTWNDATRAGTATSWAKHQEDTPARVYHVEPTEHLETDEQGNARSRTGFKVIGEAK